MKTPISPEKTRLISQGTDAYKPTMSQVAYEKHPNTKVTFELKNRRNAQKLSKYVDPTALQERLNEFQHGWTPEEVEFLGSQLRRGNTVGLFTDEYLGYLQHSQLPDVSVTIDPESDDLKVTATGQWAMVTFWETVVMSEINEMYFESFVTKNGLDLEEIYDEGDRRLSEKIAILQARRDIRFADFGTRRRFSYRWQKHVLSRLMSECPDSIIGTSNVWLAKEFGITPIGTFAHEMPMVYAALERQAGGNPLDGHAKMLADWNDKYDGNLSTALTDTFTSDFFFADFTKEQAKVWQSLRQDSGDTVEFGEKTIAFYENYGINPLDKTIVFSDGLDIDEILRIADHFAGKIKVVFGWGTTLTNDLGLQTLNIVMKAISTDGEYNVKLSDDEGKELGPQDIIADYRSRAMDRILHKSGVTV